MTIDGHLGRRPRISDTKVATARQHRNIEVRRGPDSRGQTRLTCRHGPHGQRGRRKIMTAMRAVIRPLIPNEVLRDRIPKESVRSRFAE